MNDKPDSSRIASVMLKHARERLLDEAGMRILVEPVGEAKPVCEQHGEWLRNERNAICAASGAALDALGVKYGVKRGRAKYTVATPESDLNYREAVMVAFDTAFDAARLAAPLAADIERRAALYDHMLDVAKANGFGSITEAIAIAKRVGAASPTFQEFVASGAACSYRPDGRHGEIQCRYCGAPKPEAAPVAVGDAKPDEREIFEAHEARVHGTSNFAKTASE